MKPSKPKAWQEAKRAARRSSKGGPPGKWTRRKAALAQLLYKDKGGEWAKETRNARVARRVALQRKRAKKGIEAANGRTQTT